MQRALSGRDDVQMTLTANAEAYPAPVLMLIPAEGAAWTPDKLRRALQESEPPIYCRLEQGRLELNTHCLMPGEAEQIAEVLTATLDRWKG